MNVKNERNKENVAWFDYKYWIICKFSSDDIIFKKLQINKYFSKLIKLTLRIIFKGLLALLSISINFSLISDANEDF